jgi:hypothetical protein
MEFVCRDPNAVVRAANVQATLDAFKLLPVIGRKLIAQHGLTVDDLAADKFIRVQRWLDALKDIQDTVGPDKVRAVGRNIVEVANFPPEFTDAESILMALDDVYQLNHHGDVGHYYTSRAPDGAIVVRCETPYPRMFEWGLIEGICRNPQAHGRFDIQYEPGPPDADVTCTLRVHRL